MRCCEGNPCVVGRQGVDKMTISHNLHFTCSVTVVTGVWRLGWFPVCPIGRFHEALLVNSWAKARSQRDGNVR